MLERSSRAKRGEVSVCVCGGETERGLTSTWGLGKIKQAIERVTGLGIE